MEVAGWRRYSFRDLASVGRCDLPLPANTGRREPGLCTAIRQADDLRETFLRAAIKHAANRAHDAQAGIGFAGVRVMRLLLPLGTFGIFPDVFEKVADEKYGHAEHEGNPGRTHEADIRGEKVFESMHPGLRLSRLIGLDAPGTSLSLLYIKGYPGRSRASQSGLWSKAPHDDAQPMLTGTRRGPPSATAQKKATPIAVRP